MKRADKRNVAQGLAAWSSGNLDRAVKLLEPLVQWPLEAVYPLARAYSERGEKDNALLLIAPVVSKGAEAAKLIRAEVLFDHGPADQAKSELEALAASNPIAAGLLALLSFHCPRTTAPDATPTESVSNIPADAVRATAPEAPGAHQAPRRGRPPPGGRCGGGPSSPTSKETQSLSDFCSGSEIALPRAARWMSSVMGRLLAALETHLLATGADKFITYHTRALLPDPPDSDDPIDQALAAGDLKEVIRICRQKEKPAATPAGLGKVRLRLRKLFGRVKNYPPIYRQWMIAFAQTLLGEEAEAGKAIARALEEGDARMDFLLLAGLHHARFGRRREAGATFACAARLGDVVVSDNIDALAKHLGIAIRLCD